MAEVSPSKRGSDFYPIQPIDNAKDRRGWRQSRLLRWSMAAGCCALGAANTGVTIDTGDIDIYDPVGHLRPENKQTKKSVTAVIFNFNNRRNLDQQLEYIDSIQPDFILAQEVSQRNIKYYQKSSLRGYYVTFTSAGTLVGGFPGKFGDAIFSKYRPQGIAWEQFQGGVQYDQLSSTAVVTSPFKTFSRARQENREATAVTFRVPFFKGTLPVRVINTHIAGPYGVGDKEFEAVKEFTDGQMEGNKTLDIIGGDYNRDVAQVAEVFSSPKIVVSDFGGWTSVQNHKQIDHLMYERQINYDDRTWRILGKTAILPVHTDHKAAMLTVTPVILWP